MTLTLVTPPAGLVISPMDARAHLRIDGEAEDDLIAGYIAAATGMLDGASGILGRALRTQTWRSTLDDFPDVIEVPLPPLQLTGSPPAAAVAIDYIDPAGAVQTLDPSQYTVYGAGGSAPARIAARYDSRWPATRRHPGAVTVTFTCGYGDHGEDVPAPIRQAMLLMVGDLYSLREDHIPAVTLASLGTVDRLLAPYRVW